MADWFTYTVEQVPAVAEVLERRAAQKGTQLQTVLIRSAMSYLSILPDADFQRQMRLLRSSWLSEFLERWGKDASHPKTAYLQF